MLYCVKYCDKIHLLPICQLDNWTSFINSYNLNYRYLLENAANFKLLYMTLITLIYYKSELVNALYKTGVYYHYMTDYCYCQTLV